MRPDAWVFCDCIEKRRIRKAHPYPNLLFIDEYGGPNIASDNLEMQIEHDQWVRDSACEHKDCMLIRRRIGNVAFVGWIRHSLRAYSPEPEREYPIIWTKVVYSGFHCGDLLMVEDVRLMEAELARLNQLDLTWRIPRWLRNARPGIYWRLAPKKELQKRVLSEFIEKMTELARAALIVNKPVCF